MIKDTVFYESLKNAQPIAFLASFSIIIGIVSLGNGLDKIHRDAMTAGFMFIFSFILSLIFQIFGNRNPGGAGWARYSTYFFFAIGLFHLIIIAITFSESIIKIPQYVAGWLFFSLGAGVFVRAISIKKSHINKFSRLYDKTGPALMGMGFLIIGAYALFVTFTGYSPFDWVWSLYVGMPISFLGVAIMMYGYFWIEREYKKTLD